MKVLIQGDDVSSGDRKVQKFLSTDIMNIPVVTMTKFRLVSGSWCTLNDKLICSHCVDFDTRPESLSCLVGRL